MIITIGEVVWDIFTAQDKKELGGAPINVAYHLRCLYMDVKIITRVGRDELGEATLDRLAALGLPLAGVQRDDALPTGRVHITVDAENEPHFDIVAPAAWDNIDRDEALGFVGDAPFSLVFGTLAQRHERSREAIRSLRQKADRRFYDVNLRPPYTTKELVLASLVDADVVKMNGAELLKIAQWAECGTQDKQEAARHLRARFGIDALAVTEGKEGAWVSTGAGVFADSGAPVTVADTVGAGDAFFAVLVEGCINARPWPETLARANQRGGYVASQHGATPLMPVWVK